MRLLDRHRSFYLAAGAAIVAGAATLRLAPALAVVVTANAFFACYLTLALIGLPQLTVDYLRRHAARSDAPVLIIFLVTLAAVAVAVVSLFSAIDTRATDSLYFALALAAVPLGWCTIHMMAAIHYAHLYWQPDVQIGTERVSSTASRGLDFPGSSEPSGIDFVYFAYIIGMTAQTSDVAITTSAMRRMNILHAIVSFFFNTVLVAAAVNIAVTLPG